MQILLIGMPAAGKTTVGEILASQLNCDFFDTDMLLSAANNMSTADFILQNGEQAFRTCECSILESIPKTTAIIASGGGIVTYKPSFDYIQSRFTKIVYLQTSLQELNKRLIQDEKIRPLMNEYSLVNLATKREALYEELAEYTINTDNKLVEEIVTDLILYSKRG